MFFSNRVKKSGYEFRTEKHKRFKIREIVIAENLALSENSNSVRVMDVHTKEYLYVYKTNIQENFSYALSALNIRQTEIPKLVVATPVDLKEDFLNMLKNDENNITYQNSKLDRIPFVEDPDLMMFGRVSIQ